MASKEQKNLQQGYESDVKRSAPFSKRSWKRWKTAVRTGRNSEGKWTNEKGKTKKTVCNSPYDWTVNLGEPKANNVQMDDGLPDRT